jgi:asparagine synthase (glutamine-hydrolysing)
MGRVDTLNAFCFVFSRRGAVCERHVFENMLGRLDYAGHDGKDVYIQPGAAFGVQHFNTLPEDSSERQPLQDLEGRFTILFNGRIDNRPELHHSLNLDADDYSRSDAWLALEAYRQWGELAFLRLSGPYVLVIYDAVSQDLTCARDALGGRSLYYFINPDWLVAGTSIEAVLAHPQVPQEVDEVRLAQYCAFQYPATGRTFYQAVTELVPAHFLKVNTENIRLTRYWAPDPNRQIRYRNDQEYADHYLELVENNLRACLRSNSPPGLLMSGGLDSTTLAVLACQEFEATSKGPLNTFSFVYDEFKSCDERVYIDEMISRFNINPVFIPGDQEWAMRGWQEWLVHPGWPEANPFRANIPHYYHNIQQSGTRILLTGGFGDQLFTGWEDWLDDLLFKFNFKAAFQELLEIKRNTGIKKILQSYYIRKVANRLIDFIPQSRKLRSYRRSKLPAWLTDYACHLLKPDEQFSSIDPTYGKSWTRLNMLNPSLAGNYSEAPDFAARFEIDMRFPYRDRGLVEFMMSIPVSQFFRYGLRKHLTRTAMISRLPESIRTRKIGTHLEPLFFHGFIEREQASMRSYLSRPGAAWQRYIRPEYVVPNNWENYYIEKNNSNLRLLPWHSLCLCQWLESRPVFTHEGRCQNIRLLEPCQSYN